MSDIDRDRVVQIVAAVLGQHGFETARGFELLPLGEVSVDSFAWIAVLLAIEEHLGVVVPDAAMEGAHTVTEIIEAVARAPRA